MKPNFTFPTDKIDWIHLQGDGDLDHAIDYRIKIMGCQPELGRLDMLIEFAPNSFCHFHRHAAATTTLVLEGEQHIYETRAGGEKIHRVRKAGDYAQSPGGDVHMERGGPEGALVFFAFHNPTGHLFDLLDPDESIIATTTIQDFLSGELPV